MTCSVHMPTVRSSTPPLEAIAAILLDTVHIWVRGHKV